MAGLSVETSLSLAVTPGFLKRHLTLEIADKAV